MIEWRDNAISNGNIGYYPSDGEPLLSYGDRLKSIMSQTRHDFSDHLKWWEHRGPKTCRICSNLDMLDYCIDTYISVPQQDKKGIWKFKHDTKFNTIGVIRIRK